MSQVTEPAAGQIHDLGYKRYVGTRRPPSTRWRAIARHQISSGWKGWWRYKLPLAIVVIVTVVCAMFIYVATNKMLTGATLGHSMRFADWALTVSINWSCRAAFIFSLTVGTGVIAGDMQSGAFTFYFARSTRPIDYLAGKLAGLGVLVAGLVFVFPVIVAGLRLGLSDSTQALVDQLVLVPKMMVVGVLATLVYTAVPLGFSALVANRRYAMGMWAAYYLIGGTIASLIGYVTEGWIGALDLSTAIQAVGNRWMDVDPGGTLKISYTAALLSIAGHVGISIAVVWFQLSNAQKSGVGGAT